MTHSNLSEKEAKKLVLESGLRLVREGLVARTWGNVSVRVGNSHFAITPSGIPYEKLTLETIVTVSLDNLSYSGSIKPSSEKGMHAAVYRERPEIGAVIHTHQPVASSFSAARRDITGLTGSTADLIGPHVLTSPYALPGTKKLAKGGVKALKASNAALLANHGAVCIGKEMERAFEVSLALEVLCQSMIEKAVMNKSGSKNWEPEMIHLYYLEHQKKG